MVYITNMFLVRGLWDDWSERWNNNPEAEQARRMQVLYIDVCLVKALVVSGVPEQLFHPACQQF
jgi:hypothetical protein